MEIHGNKTYAVGTVYFLAIWLRDLWGFNLPDDVVATFVESLVGLAIIFGRHAIERLGVKLKTIETLVGRAERATLRLDAAVAPDDRWASARERAGFSTLQATTICAVVCLLLLLTGCVGPLQMAAHPDEPAKETRVDDKTATVVESGKAMPKAASLSGTLVLIEIGGVVKPLICTGFLERRCLNFLDGDQIHLNEPTLRPFVEPLKIGKTEYPDYWLALGKRGARHKL